MKKNTILDLFPTLEKMKEVLHINLDTQEIIDARTGKILKQYLKINKKSRNYYKRVLFFVNGKIHWLRVNRLFFYWQHGYLPNIVDHKDKNSLNNSIENLRELTNSENIRNSFKTSRKTSSIYKGVSWNKKRKKWVAYIFVEGKLKHLGFFDNEDDAGQAYNDAVRRYGFKTAVLNDTPQERTRAINLDEATTYP